MPHVRSVSVGVWIGSGSRRESTEQNGISHFIEHMLFKGTPSRSAEDIRAKAWTPRRQSGCLYGQGTGLFQHQSAGSAPLAGLRRSGRSGAPPMFRDEDIEKEKGVVLEEIKMEEDSPDYLVTRFSRRISGKITPWASRFWARRRACGGSTAPWCAIFTMRFTRRRCARHRGREPDPRSAGGAGAGSTSSPCRGAMRRPRNRLQHARPYCAAK